MARVFEKATGKEFTCDKEMITDLVNTGRFSKKPVTAKAPAKTSEAKSVSSDDTGDTVEQVKVTSNRGRGRPAAKAK